MAGTRLPGNPLGSYMGGGGPGSPLGSGPGGTITGGGAQPPGPAGGSGGTVDPLTLLSGDQQNAAAILEQQFNAYGLGTLAPKIVEYLQNGFSADTISLLLQQTPEYKARFPANDARVKAGLPALSPAQYISTENSYRQILSTAGLPPGFYDSNNDFTNWIAGDVSPTEIQGRVNVAQNLVTNADPSTLNAFKQFYGASQGDLVAYALDRKTAEPLLEKQYAAAQIAGAGANNGVGVNQTEAETLAAAGISQSQATQGFGQIGAQQGTVNALDAIYGAHVSTEDLVNATFLNQADASQKVNRLASQERGTFSGTTGVGAASLGTRDAGQV